MPPDHAAHGSAFEGLKILHLRCFVEVLMGWEGTDSHLCLLGWKSESDCGFPMVHRHYKYVSRYFRAVLEPDFKFVPYRVGNRAFVGKCDE